jgi:Zn finger protein HypA/HybF involved in hydrogenase expression
MEELFGITPIEIKKYDGSNFPSHVNEILLKYKNKAFFGGSSLLHDAFFKDEHWASRIDYDIWCKDSVYQNILSDIEDKGLVKIHHSKYDAKYYQTFKIKELADYGFEIDRKQYIIQVINIGSCFYSLIDKIDFTFNTVLYNGENLVFFKTTEADVLKKRGELQIEVITNRCTCEECKGKKVSQKQISRIHKYKARGFEITNFCPFCKSDDYKIINVSHFQSCILNLSFPPYVLQLEDAQFQKILDIVRESTNPNVILCCLNIIARTLHMEEFLSVFHEKQCSTIFDTNSRLFNDILIDFTINGQYTFFTLFFDVLKTKIHITATPIQILFRKACAFNCINIARYISSHSQRYELSIYEDRIYQHIILTVFEHYVKYKKIQAVLDEYPGITLFENQEENEESICSICNENQSNIRLPCGHRFCDCIFSYFVTSFSTKCGICRGEGM